MSDVWKRLANVARGKVKSWTDPSEPPPEEHDDPGRTPVASAAPPRTEAPQTAPDDRQGRRREALAMALADGVISREEYEDRLADLEAGRGVPGKPKARTL